MDEKMKIKVVDVKRKRYGIITIILLFEENLLNITSSYAPQARFEDSDKKLKRVWPYMDDVIQGIPRN